MKKGTLTLKQLGKLYEEAKKFDNYRPVIVIHPNVKKTLDKVWDKLPWQQRLLLNISRIIHGMGRYPV